jgi:hypothetical protein
VGRRKTISGSCLLQVVDRAEGMVITAFIDIFNHRKMYVISKQNTSDLIRGHTAAESDLSRYCSYSENIGVVILKEIIL